MSAHRSGGELDSSGDVEREFAVLSYEQPPEVTSLPEEHEHVLPDGSVLRHGGHRHDEGDGVAVRRVRLERDLLASNDAWARENRRRFERSGTLVLHVMASPGAGKTSLLLRSLRALAERMPVAVIEGDQQTSLDTDRIRAAGVAAVQVEHQPGSPLDAAMVGRALEALPALPQGVLFIENAGSLAGLDLGETARVVVMSVAEGVEKPLKYPDLFAAADLVLVNKLDLLPHVDFSLTELEDHLEHVNRRAELMVLSARTGKGFDAWLRWVESRRAQREVPFATADL